MVTTRMASTLMSVILLVVLHVHSTLPHPGTSGSEGAGDSVFSTPVHMNACVTSYLVLLYTENSVMNWVCGDFNNAMI